LDLRDRTAGNGTLQRGSVVQCQAVCLLPVSSFTRKVKPGIQKNYKGPSQKRSRK
jgi:hypothetical protein